MINPPSKEKGRHWVNESGDAGSAATAEEWRANTTEHEGSWWVDWISWISEQAPERVPAREPGGGKLAPICDAPGEYVRAKA